MFILAYKHLDVVANIAQYFKKNHSRIIVKESIRVLAAQPEALVESKRLNNRGFQQV